MTAADETSYHHYTDRGRLVTTYLRRPVKHGHHAGFGARERAVRREALTCFTVAVMIAAATSCSAASHPHPTVTSTRSVQPLASGQSLPTLKSRLRSAVTVPLTIGGLSLIPLGITSDGSVLAVATQERAVTGDLQDGRIRLANVGIVLAAPPYRTVRTIERFSDPQTQASDAVIAGSNAAWVETPDQELALRHWRLKMADLRRGTVTTVAQYDGSIPHVTPMAAIVDGRLYWATQSPNANTLDLYRLDRRGRPHVILTDAAQPHARGHDLLVLRRRHSTNVLEVAAAPFTSSQSLSITQVGTYAVSGSDILYSTAGDGAKLHWVHQGTSRAVSVSAVAGDVAYSLVAGTTFVAWATPIRGHVMDTRTGESVPYSAIDGANDAIANGCFMAWLSKLGAAAELRVAKLC